MKPLGEYVFLKPHTLSDKSQSGIAITGDTDEPVGEDTDGVVYAYDPTHTIDITLRGEKYKVTKREFLLATL